MEYIVTIAVIWALVQFVDFMNRPKITRKYKESGRPDANYFRVLDSTAKNDPKPVHKPIRYANQFCTRAEKQEHMRSEYWLDLKAERMVIANGTCEVDGCDRQHNLHLHHTHYLTLLVESVDDVVLVCGDFYVDGTLVKGHHQQVHDKTGYSRVNTHDLSVLAN